MRRVVNHESANEVVSSAAGLTLLWLLSPATGLAFEMALAWKLGASGAVDAYRIASILTAFGWQFFVVDVLPALIVPLVARYRSKGREFDAWTIAFSLGNLLLVPTILVCVMTFRWPAPALSVLAPSFVGDRRAVARLFIRWFTITFIPLVWAGVATGLLYAEGVFWVPVAASICGNLVILTVLLGASSVSVEVALVAGTLAASLLTLALLMLTLLPWMRRAQVSLRVLVSFKLNSESVRNNVVMALPLMAVVFAGHAVAIAINRALGREQPGTVATFGYAWKMLTLVTLSPTALATVLFPRFAETWQSATPEGFSQTCTRGVRMGLYLSLPIAGACFVLRLPLTLLLFHRGAYSLQAATTTARYFGLLLLAAPGSVLCAYIQRIFYATQDTLTPSLVQLTAYTVLFVSAPLIGRRCGGNGLCVLVTVTQWLSCALLMVKLRMNHRVLDFAGTVVLAAQLFPLSVVSAWAGGHVFLNLSPLWQVSNTLSLMFRITVTLGCIAAIFTVLTLALRIPEALAWPHHLRASGSRLMRLTFLRNG
jgi:putative peptidoglycan lipid II flippase